MPTTSRQQDGEQRRPRWRYGMARLTGRSNRGNPARGTVSSVPIMMGTMTGLLGIGSIAVLSLTCASPDPSGRQLPIGIQGAQALRLDLLRQARWPFAQPNHPHRHGQPPLRDGEPPGPRTPGASAIDPAAGSRESSIKVVCEFYRWLHDDPAIAVPLVTPDVLGDETAVVTHSWTEVAAVRPRHVRVDPNGTVVAVVLVEYSDGSKLLLRHRLTVQPGPQPRISKVELLAARSFRS